MKKDEVCFGCNKVIEGKLYSHAVTLEIAPGREVKVHQNLTKSPAFYGNDWARESCVKKARYNNPYCIGCGKDNEGAFCICQECEDAVGRAKNAPEEEELSWIAINLSGLLPEHPSDEDWENRKEDRIADLLCKMLARRGRWSKSCLSAPISAYNMNNVYARKGGTVTTGDPAVEITEQQQKALSELVKILAESFEIQYRLGTERGHNSLVRLAMGEIGPDEFDAVREKDLKVRIG